jgi:hypothetical protein
VRPTAEVRPANATANSTVPAAGSFTLKSLNNQVGYDNRTPNLEARVTGNFKGTTDEIIQWASCKWGFDEDQVRAIAATESWWRQSQVGDVTTNQALCPPGLTAPCPRSFGIHQVTWNVDPMGTYSLSTTSTAFNLDASLLVHRVCYEGYMTWLRNIGYQSYAAGDDWGCVGQWYSGNWHDAAAETYIAKVKGYVTTKPWALASFVEAVTTTLGVRYDFENGTTQGWATGWGPVSVANTTSQAYAGTRGLAMTLGPTGADWPAVQVSSPVGLASGKLVTYWVYQPSGSTLASVSPYVADLNWADAFAPSKTLAAGWNKVTWTVPTVNGIKAIGLMFNDDSGWNGTLVLDSVSW